MKINKIKEFNKGWFIGNFEPTLIKTDAFECAAKFYAAGDAEAKHTHKEACEITVVGEGEIEMLGRRFHKGDVIFLDPGESADFTAVTAALTFVVKMPSVIGDKYISEE